MSKGCRKGCRRVFLRPFRPSGRQKMVIDPTLQLLLAGLVAGFGSFVLWKFYGKRLLIEYGAQQVWTKLEDMITHPDSPDAQRFGRAVGLAMAYAFKGLNEMIQTPEGREQLKPIYTSMFELVRQSIFGTYGSIMKDLKTKGESGSPIGNLPPEILGMGQKLFPGIDLQQAMGLLSFVQRFSGGNKQQSLPVEGSSHTPSGSFDLKVG